MPTIYDFSSLFAEAWHNNNSKECSNIVSGFKITGEYSFNRCVIHLPEVEFTKFKAEALAKSKT